MDATVARNSRERIAAFRPFWTSRLSIHLFTSRTSILYPTLTAISLSPPQIEPNTAFLRAARAGQLDTVVDLLSSGAVKDINTCNSVSYYTGVKGVVFL